MSAKTNTEFYRSLILEHMQLVGIEVKNDSYDLSKPEDVKRLVKEIGRRHGGGRNAEAMREKIAFWLGQLYLLDWINEMENTYYAAAEERGVRMDENQG